MPVEKRELTAAEIEAENERQNELDAGNGTEDLELPEDGGGDPEPRQEEEPEERSKPVPMSPQDEKRARMAERFQRRDVRPFDGDLAKPENIYGDVADETLQQQDDTGGNPDPDPAADAAAADGTSPEGDKPAPRMITRKVRGVDVTKSEDEWLELASKVAAGDSYLEESRQLLEDAKEIRNSRRAAPDPQHPEGEDRTQDGRTGQDDRPAPRHPGVDLSDVVESIQFGDPAEAGKKLGAAIQTAAEKIANDGHVARLVSNDLAKSKASLATFMEKHKDLAADPIASNAIENQVYGVYREEIKALGLCDEAQIPKDPKVLADWHRLYRVHGHAVSSTDDVLQKAKSRFDAWRGTPSEQPKPKPAPGDGKARVEVNVNRTERRMAIPNQPSAATTPRRPAPQPQTQESSRKSAVQEMRKSRGQIVT